MQRKRGLLLTLILVVSVSPAVLAQHEEHGQRPQMQPGSEGAHAMMDCKAMMQRHEQMRARMGEMDQRLDRLVTAMNSASGQQKIDAMAAVIQTLVEQRREMRMQMMQMQPMMMQHMMGHMQQGMAAMHDCPIMHGGEARPESDDGHKH